MRQREQTVNHYQTETEKLQQKFNISYYSKKRQNHPSDLEFRKAADAESSGAIISSVQIPGVGNAHTISVTF